MVNEIENARELVEEGQLLEAAKKLKSVAEDCKNKKAADSASLLMMRINTLEIDRAKERVTYDNYSVKKNKIGISILQELNELDSEDFTNSSNKENSSLVSSENKMLELAKAANIIVEIAKAKQRFYEQNWIDRATTLRELYKFSEHNSIHVAEEIIRFLDNVAPMTRAGMNSDTAQSVFGLLIEYFPYSSDKAHEGSSQIFLSRSIDIAQNILYDAIVYLKNLKVGVQALQIMKWAYMRRNKDQAIVDKIENVYDKMLKTLDRQEIKNSGNARELLHTFREDLTNPNLAFPPMSEHLFKLIT